MRSDTSESSLSLGLSLGFALVLLLMIGLTVVGLIRMADIKQRMDQVVGENNVKTALAHAMKDALRDRAIIMHSISLLTDPFEQDEEFLAFNEHAATFSNSRARFEAMSLGVAEQDILAEIRPLTAKTQPLVVSSLDHAMSGNHAEARKLIKEEIVPLQKAIASKIDELLGVQHAETSKAVEETTRAYTNTRLLMLLFGGAAVGLGLIIAVVVVRHATRQARVLQHQAMFDSLTDLPNRALFADRLHQAILVAGRERTAFSLIAMDLDGFKEINDSCGHHVGDGVLRQVAQRARATLRGSDTVARMGGDEFTILLPTVSDLDGAVAVARKLLDALRQPLEIGGHRLEAGASIGIAMYPEHADEPGALMRQADTAMYVAKRTHAGFVAYSTDIDERSDNRAMLQADLRRAIADGELVLHYQPKIDFDTNQISGVEALARWQHPEHGLLPPDRFIPLAEQTGLIKPLTRAVLRMALRQCEEWHKAGLNLSVAVNVSAVNVLDPDFGEEVARLLEEFAVPPSHLELEVTESAVMTDPVRAVECVKRLRAIGLQISIDDFGTGYASMTYLKQLLVAKIKIDKSFVKDMAVNHHDAVIVRSTVELGHNLGLKVIAEGVEDQAVWERLKTLGCDSAQGYYMSRPVPAGVFIEWLRQSPWGTGPGDSENGVDK